MARQRAFMALSIIVWLSAVAAGLVSVLRYEYTPGAAAQAPPRWPVASGLPLAGDRPTLLMVIHPRCPCTSASLAELERVLSRHPGRARVTLLFVHPVGAGAEWKLTDSWQKAGQLPGFTERLLDPDGRRAACFGARTSGQAYLYSPTGELLFSGGLTGSRGHEGENEGSLALARLLQDQKNQGTTVLTEVYGCPAARSDQDDRCCRQSEKGSPHGP